MKKFISSFLSWLLATSVVFGNFLDKRNEDWLQRPFDLYVLGEAIYDQTFEFTDRAVLEDYLANTLGVQIGDGVLVKEHHVQDILERFTPSHGGAGGAACNTLVGVSHMGGHTIFAGVVANDESGRAFRRDMEAYDLKLHLRVDDGLDGKTGTVMALLDPCGERTMPAYPGVSVKASLEDVDLSELADSKVILIEGYLWNHGSNNQMVDQLFSLAQERGVHTAFTFGDVYLVKTRREELLALTSRVDIIFSDDTQMKALIETEDFDQMIAGVQKIAHIAVITQGKEGAWVVTPGEVFHIPPPHIASPILDTTGAGDQFAAGFLYGYTQGKSLEACGSLGAQAAARILVQIGAKPKLTQPKPIHIDKKRPSEDPGPISGAEAVDLI